MAGYVVLEKLVNNSCMQKINKILSKSKVSGVNDHTVRLTQPPTKLSWPAGAELWQAQVKIEIIVVIGVKVEFEIVIEVGIQLLARVLGGGWVD